MIDYFFFCVWIRTCFLCIFHFFIFIFIWLITFSVIFISRAILIFISFISKCLLLLLLRLFVIIFSNFRNDILLLFTLINFIGLLILLLLHINNLLFEIIFVIVWILSWILISIMFVLASLFFAVIALFWIALIFFYSAVLIIFLPASGFFLNINFLFFFYLILWNTWWILILSYVLCRGFSYKVFLPRIIISLWSITVHNKKWIKTNIYAKFNFISKYLENINFCEWDQKENWHLIYC